MIFVISDDIQLDIVESIGWISGSSEREDIMKQHMLDMMTQQPNDSNDNDSHLRRSTDSKDSTGNRPRSMPSSPLKSGNNSSNNIPPPPYPQGSPNKVKSCTHRLCSSDLTFYQTFPVL